MTIEIRKPELEKLVQEEFVSGHFQSVDDLLTEALRALRERNALIAPTQAEAIKPARSKPESATSHPRKNLAQFLMESPFAGSDLNLERQQDYGRPIEL
jgi:Arc/MetJ-type ribon-helix-helix transcriptional regulator